MRILRIINDPIIDGRHMSKWFGVDIRSLHSDVLSRLEQMTGEKYTICGEITNDEFFIKEDGFCYTPDSYKNVLNQKVKPHVPDFMNYDLFISKFNLIEMKNQYLFDEIHFYSIPFGGAFESRMVGNRAIYCNSAPYPAPCDNFVIMGFSFERGVIEAIEAYMHRVEFILQYAYPLFWNGFSKDVGRIHTPHNTDKDYDWGNKTDVLCYADRYIMNDYEFVPVMRNSDYWGSNGLGYFDYWFSHIPKSKIDVVVHPNKI
jgi:hypothetical protein